MRRRDDAAPPLQEVCLEIISECPMNCIHCSSYAPAEEGHCLDLSTVRRLLDDVSVFGNSVVEFSGGEPLCHPDLVKMIEHSSKDGLVPCIYTSGVHFSDRNLQPIPPQLVGALVEAGLERVVLSVHGASPDTHESINRVAGTFEMTIESIRRLKHQDVWVGVHFVPVRPNWREAQAVAELCASLQVDELAVLRFVPQGRGQVYRHRLQLNRADYCELLCKLRALRSDYSGVLRVRIGSPLNFCSFYPRSTEQDTFPTPCQAGIGTCTVLPTGKVVPCPAFKHQVDWRAGSIFEKSFAEIWKNSGVFSTLRSFDCDLLAGPCRDCEFLEVCRGRCHAQRVIAWGELSQGPDPLCPYASYSGQEKRTQRACSQILRV